jgi:hypothetical protein
MTPATWQQWPHQAVYYYNHVAKKEGKPHRWAAKRDLLGRWYIQRVDSIPMIPYGTPAL